MKYNKYKKNLYDDRKYKLTTYIALVEFKKLNKVTILSIK